jgi:hypothetical protein
MASLSNPVNIKKLLDAQQVAINENTNTKASAINVEVANKATDTQNAIVADGDVTQAKLDGITTVNGDISNDVQAINAHVTTESERIIAATPSPIKSVQRGTAGISNAYSLNVALSAVNPDKCNVSIYNQVGKFYVGSLSANELVLTRLEYAAYQAVSWEVVEYV